MSIDEKDQKLSWSWLVLCWSVLLLPLGAFSQEGALDKPTGLVVNTRIARQILSLIQKETSVAIVRFETDFQEQIKIENKEKVNVPATVVHFNEKDEPGVRIRGVFDLEKRLRGNVPELGRIDETIPLTSLRPMDPTWQRIRS